MPETKCLCGHAVWQHDFQWSGKCDHCTCKQYVPDGDMLPPGIVTPGEALASMTQAQRERELAARAKCLRCGLEHGVTSYAIAMECPMVESVQFSHDGAIVMAIVFREPPPPQLTVHNGVSLEGYTALQQFNTRIDKLESAVLSLQVATGGAVCALCGHGEQFHSHSGCIASVKGRLCDCQTFSLF